MIAQCEGCGEWREIRYAFDDTQGPECDDCADREEAVRIAREEMFYHQVDLPAARAWINRNA